MIVDASEFSLWSTGTTTAEMLISSSRILDSTVSLTVQLCRVFLVQKHLLTGNEDT